MSHISQKTSYFVAGLVSGLVFSSVLYALNTDFQRDLVSSVFQINNSSKGAPETSPQAAPAQTNLTSSPEKDFATGLREMTQEEKLRMSKERVLAIHPNKVGKDRINEHRKSKGLDPIDDSSAVELETISTLDGGASLISSTTSTTSLVSAVPAQVDNSTLAAFPPIGNQGSLGSCVSWATVYYQMSHEVCLTLGCDNKNTTATRFSPKWAYNMVNFGQNAGSYFSDNYSLIQTSGAPSLDELPYDSNYLSWDLNADHWKKAVNYRQNPVSYIAMGSTSGIDLAKQALANGHILVVGTYISSAIYSTVQNAPGETSPFAGQSVITYLNGTSGGHAMTVVGYDDSIWTDINGNSVVDTGERGAFKVANSWGAGWRNAGYIWVTYDAFYSTSQVPGFAPAGRWPFGYNGTNSLYLTSYTQKSRPILAKVTVSHASRSQMSLSFGISPNTSNTPTSYFYPSALSYKGGSYAFNGSSTETPGTFYYDLTDIITGTSTIDNSILYLMGYDNSTGNPLTVTSFEIIDGITGGILGTASGTPITLDQSNTTLKIGSYAGDTIAPTAPSNLNYTLTTTTGKGRKATTTTTVNLTWTASTDNVGVQKYMIYRNGVKLGESTSAKYGDTTTKAGSTYTYYVVAQDAAANVSNQSNTLSISR